MMVVVGAAGGMMMRGMEIVVAVMSVQVLFLCYCQTVFIRLCYLFINSLCG